MSGFFVLIARHYARSAGAVQMNPVRDCVRVSNGVNTLLGITCLEKKHEREHSGTEPVERGIAPERIHANHSEMLAEQRSHLAPREVVDVCRIGERCITFSSKEKPQTIL